MTALDKRKLPLPGNPTAVRNRATDKARHLLGYWDELEADLAQRFLYLFFDFDGTLAPIVRNPSKAILSHSMRGRLETLRTTPRCRIAVISGRALDDIRQRVGIDGITYGGNHGLEVDGPEGTFRFPLSGRVRRTLNAVRGSVTRALSAIPGTFLEDKGATMAVHTRRVKRGDLAIAVYALLEATESHRTRGEIVIRPGKEVFEIRPSVEWDKGKTVRWLLEKNTLAGREPPWPIFMGDDRTDEDAFREIRGRGITVYVGTPRQTEACYYLRSIKEVSAFLGRLARIRKKR